MYMDVPMNLDNSLSNEPNNTHIQIRLNNMEELKNELKTILVFGKKYIYDYERGMRNDMSPDRYRRKLNELILKIHLASNMYFQHDDKTYNIFNFNMPENNNNNLLMFFCSVNFNSTICNHIINKYGNMFDLGHINDSGETALILCIKSKMGDVALNLINKYGHLFDLGDVNENGDNALIICIKNKMDDVALKLINEHGHLFDLGHVNKNGKTALMLCIQNKMGDVALNLINYRYDPFEYDYPNMGQQDIRGQNSVGQNALDYMLSYIVYEDDDTIKPSNNKFITDNIDIISELLFFHLDKLHDDPGNELSQYYIDFFCKTRDFWRPLLEDDFEENEYIDFKKTTKNHKNKVCDDIKNFEAKPLYNDEIATVVEDQHIDYQAPVAEIYQPHQPRIFGHDVERILPPIILHSPSRRRSRSRSRSRSQEKRRRVGGKKTIHKVKSKTRKTIRRKKTIRK